MERLLHLALKVTETKPGDEIITIFNFCGNVTISYAGATPVFVDVDSDTLSIN